MARAIILVALGGGLGSLLRYMTSVWVQKYFQHIFPLATFLTNITGCFIIGILVGIFSQSHESNTDMKLLLITGFCGGYTTFSAFSLENVNLIQSGHSLLAFTYIALSIGLGFLAVWLGITITKFI